MLYVANGEKKFRAGKSDRLLGQRRRGFQSADWLVATHERPRQSLRPGGDRNGAGVLSAAQRRQHCQGNAIDAGGAGIGQALYL